MGLLSGFLSDGSIAQISQCGSLAEPNVQKAITKLKKSPKSSIPKLAEALQSTNKQGNSHIIEVLTDLASSSTLDYYIPLLGNDVEVIRQGVAEALSQAENIDPNPLVGKLADPNLSKTAIMNILTAHKEKLRAVNLIKFVFNVDHNEQVALFKIIDSVATDTVVTEIVNRIDTKEAFIRSNFAKILRKFDRPQVHHALEKLLDDENKSVRLAALDGLSHMKGEISIDRLTQLIDDSDYAVQNKAVETIVTIKHPETVTHLVEHLKSESEYTRRAAVEVLNEIANPTSVKDLFRILKDEDWWVRSRAADALGKIGGPKVVKAVLILLKDKDEFVRRSAIEIINATEDESTYDALVDSLNDSDWWVRERAVDGLANLGNRQAVPMLIKLLQKNETNENDKNIESMGIILLQALGKLEAKSAIPYVIKQLWAKSENIVKETLACLERLVDDMSVDEVVSSIGHALENRDEELRELGGCSIDRILDNQNKQRTDIRATLSRSSDRSDSERTMPGTIIRGKAELQPKSVDPTKLQPDDILAGRYKFIRQVGKGAFGAVFLMEDLMINEDVILKFLNAQFVSDESVIKRFIYELRFARKVTHQNVIRIYDLITFGESHAISMEYFESHTLSAELKERKPLANERAIKIASDICNGMESAHSAKVIHRDLKPNNVMINEDNLLKIVDFGIAAASQSSDTKLTKTGLLVGTPTYMSPEQVLGKDIDERTDIYSLGTMFYEMLTGRPPYSGKDSMSIMYQHVQGEAKPPIEKNDQVPIELSNLVMDCMKVKPEERIQSMTELSERLKLFNT
ncbi:MAG: HEAT repeat domain-containing protein [Gammaproteobacteria bacterium]